jgi:hypothetical protein
MTGTAERLLNWLMDNTSLLLLILLIVLLGVFEIIGKIKGKPEGVSDKLYFGAILAGLVPILIIMGQVTVALRDRPKTEIVQPDTLIDLLYTPLKAEYVQDNPYVEDRISSTLERLKHQLRDHRLETNAIDMTREELERGITLVHKDDQVIGIDYGFVPWKQSFSTYARKNEEQAKAGVSISRIFIIPNQILKDDRCLIDLIDTMTKQNNSKVKVRVALKTTLEDKYSDKYKFRRGMVIFNYKKGQKAVILEEYGDVEVQGCSFPQYAVQALWDQKSQAFLERQKQLQWLLSQEPRDAVCDYDAEKHPDIIRSKQNPCK